MEDCDIYSIKGSWLIAGYVKGTTQPTHWLEHFPSNGNAMWQYCQSQLLKPHGNWFTNSWLHSFSLGPKVFKLYTPMFKTYFTSCHLYTVPTGAASNITTWHKPNSILCRKGSATGCGLCCKHWQRSCSYLHTSLKAKVLYIYIYFGLGKN